MKLKNNEGVLVVEASLSLFIFMFFLLFIWSFSGVFAAQNAVSHAALQSVQSISVDNMSKEIVLGDEANRAETLSLANRILSLFSEEESTIGVKFEDLPNKTERFKDSFMYFLGGEDGEADARRLGIDTNTMTFEVDEGALENGYVRVTVRYTVYFKFAIFGIESIDLEKHAECRLFGFSE